MIWERDNYMADIESIFNRTIVEYDMKSANTSLAKEFNLLPKDLITELENLPKQEREIRVGLLKRNDKGYSNKEKEAFKEARRIFIETNHIQPEDILSIKKDAFFLLTYVDEEQVTDNILFRKKNVYTSFLMLKGVEVYYNQNGIDVKHISDEFYKEYHSEYFGKFLSDMIRKVETVSKKNYLNYIRGFWCQYKWKELDSGYYREFNARSAFRYLNGEVSMEEYMEDKNMLDISYNMGCIIDLVNILL